MPYPQVVCLACLRRQNVHPGSWLFKTEDTPRARLVDRNPVVCMAVLVVIATIQDIHTEHSLLTVQFPALARRQSLLVLLEPQPLTADEEIARSRPV